MVNDEGIFICPILFPAIPKGTNRLRAHVLTDHTPEDIDKTLDIFERAGKKLELIRLQARIDSYLHHFRMISVYLMEPIASV